MIVPPFAAPAVAASAIAAPAVAAPLRVERAAGSWRAFAPQREDGLFIGIARGADGALWLSDFYHGLVRLDAAGKRTLYSLSFTRQGTTHRFLPAYLVAGPNAKLILTGCVDTEATCGAIGIASLDGTLAVVPTPSGESARFSGLAAAPNGDVWFTEASHLAKITPAGRIVEYVYGTGETLNVLSGVAIGRDGAVWFTELDRIAAAKFEPHSGVLNEVSLRAQNIDCGVSGMTAASDGSVYFGCGVGFVAMKPNGKATYYYTDYQPSNGAQEFVADADGFIWGAALGVLERFAPAEQTLTLYPAPPGELTLYGSIVAANGQPWVLSETGTVYAFSAPRSARGGQR